MSSADDFQIMVNGSWSFVSDPHREYDHANSENNAPRLVLVAPSGYHDAHIYGGKDPDGYTDNDKIDPSGSSNNLAVWYIDFKRSDGAGPNPHETSATTYRTKNDTTWETIAKVVFAFDPEISRYAISLPMPDYIRTYERGKYSPYAHSKVADGPIDIMNTQEVGYSIWTILHYNVDSVPKAIGLHKLDKGTLVTSNCLPRKSCTVPVSSSAISIVAMDPKDDSDLLCDGVSSFSFAASMKMWDLNDHARFPIETDQSGTQSDKYDSTCPDAAKDTFPVWKPRVQQFKKLQQDVKAFTTLLATQFESRQPSNPKKMRAQRNRDSLQTDFTNMEKDFSDLFHPVPQDIQQGLDCTAEVLKLTKNPASGQCPTDKRDLFDRYYTGDGPIILSATGSTDCHMSPLNINSVLNGLTELTQR